MLVTFAQLVIQHIVSMQVSLASLGLLYCTGWRTELHFVVESFSGHKVSRQINKNFCKIETMSARNLCDMGVIYSRV